MRSALAVVWLLSTVSTAALATVRMTRAAKRIQAQYRTRQTQHKSAGGGGDPPTKGGGNGPPPLKKRGAGGGGAGDGAGSTSGAPPNALPPGGTEQSEEVSATGGGANRSPSEAPKASTVEGAEQDEAATSIQARFRGNHARRIQTIRHMHAGAAAVMAVAGEHVHTTRVENAQATPAPACTVTGGSISRTGKGPPPLKKRGAGGGGAGPPPMKSSVANRTLTPQAAKAPVEFQTSNPDTTVAGGGLGRSIEVQHSVNADVIDAANEGEIDMSPKAG